MLSRRRSVPLSLLLVAGLSSPAFSSPKQSSPKQSSPTQADPHPAAVQRLLDRGVDLAGTFEAPGGLTGYAGSMQGQPVAFYLTPDGDHVIVGPMLDADGNNLTDDKVQQLVIEPMNQNAWSRLADSHWVGDGDPDAETVVYTFTDPNCPYCHRFRQAAQPWIDAGRVQLRHVMVGIIRPDSMPKAATILGAESPESALMANHQSYQEGGIEVDRESVSAYRAKVTANNELMSSLGLSATPSTYYLNADGDVEMKRGLPRPEEMPAMMGSERPQ